MDGYCGKCSGGSVIVIGVLLLAKEWIFVNMSWGLFIGLLLVFIGIMRVIRPSCGCGGCCTPPAESKPVVKAKKK